MTAKIEKENARLKEELAEVRSARSRQESSLCDALAAYEEQVLAITRERAELLTALENITEFAGGAPTDIMDWRDWSEVIAKSRAAIANARKDDK